MTKTIEKFAPGVVFTLASASSIEWLLHRYVYEKPAEVHMELSEQFFSPDYFTARSRFRQMTTSAGGRLETVPLDARGPNGEALDIDIAWFGAANPRRVLLHSSGLHGVEGFAGSAIQLQLLNELPAIPEDAALIVVHVLNPYGMAWLRRFNENNVDLNRNFLNVKADADTSFQLQLALSSYRKFNSFLNPPNPPASDLFFFKAAALILKHGMPELKQAVVGGQYWFPEGLFFGGKLLSGGVVTPEQGRAKYQTFLAQLLSSAERIVAVDVHTGLGKYGEDTLLAKQEHYNTLQHMFGNRVAPMNPKKGPAYRALGSLDSMLPRALPNARVFAITQEFGTYSPTKVLHALREENRWNHYGAGTLDHPTKRILKDTFYPQDETWRNSVLNRGKEVLKQGLSKL